MGNERVNTGRNEAENTQSSRYIKYKYIFNLITVTVCFFCAATQSVRVS